MVESLWSTSAHCKMQATTTWWASHSTSAQSTARASALCNTRWAISIWLTASRIWRSKTRTEIWPEMGLERPIHPTSQQSITTSWPQRSTQWATEGTPSIWRPKKDSEIWTQPIMVPLSSAANLSGKPCPTIWQRGTSSTARKSPRHASPRLPLTREAARASPCARLTTARWTDKAQRHPWILNKVRIKSEEEASPPSACPLLRNTTLLQPTRRFGDWAAQTTTMWRTTRCQHRSRWCAQEAQRSQLTWRRTRTLQLIRQARQRLHRVRFRRERSRHASWWPTR